METIEKNDVDITKLFGWGRVYEVINPDTEEVSATVYMKLLGDADLNRARIYALRKSSELRRELKNPDSDHRLAYIRDMDELTEEDIINLISILSLRDISTRVAKEVKITRPKLPKSDASLEKMEQFQKDVDEYPEKRRKEIQKSVENQMESLKSELSTKSKEELYKRYVKSMIDEMCEKEAMDAFTDMQVYLGCYKNSDYKAEDRFFSSFDDFDNLEPSVKENFKVAYNNLDIELGELKKLRRATQ